MKTSRDEGIKQFSIQHPSILFSLLCGKIHVCKMVLYTELFYALIPACFHTFCCSVIPTSPYIFNVFTLVYLVTELVLGDRVVCFSLIEASRRLTLY